MEMTALRALMLRGGGSGGGGGGSGMELVKSYTYDKNLIDDNVIQSFPQYGTSTQTLVASDEIEQLTLDLSTYYYFVFTRSLIIPSYNTTDKDVGRQEYYLVSQIDLPYKAPNNIPCISDTTKTYNLSGTSFGTKIYSQLLVYWKNTSEINGVLSTSYGIYPNLPTMQLTNDKLSVKNPAVYMRGNNTYFNSTYWSAMTDARFQYIIDVYKMPKEGASNVFFWQFEHILDCVRANDHKLT